MKSMNGGRSPPLKLSGARNWGPPFCLAWDGGSFPCCLGFPPWFLGGPIGEWSRDAGGEPGPVGRGVERVWVQGRLPRPWLFLPLGRGASSTSTPICSGGPGAPKPRGEQGNGGGCPGSLSFCSDGPTLPPLLPTAFSFSGRMGAILTGPERTPAEASRVLWAAEKGSWKPRQRLGRGGLLEGPLPLCLIN